MPVGTGGLNSPHAGPFPPFSPLARLNSLIQMPYTTEATGPTLAEIEGQTLAVEAEESSPDGDDSAPEPTAEGGR